MFAGVQFDPHGTPPIVPQRVIVGPIALSNVGSQSMGLGFNARTSTQGLRLKGSKLRASTQGLQFKGGRGQIEASSQGGLPVLKGSLDRDAPAAAIKAYKGRIKDRVAPESAQPPVLAPSRHRQRKEKHYS